MARDREYKIVFKQEGAERVQKETNLIDKAMGDLEKNAKKLGAAALSAAASFAAFQSLRIAGQFEALQARIENMFLGVDEGRKAFEKFREVAASTPYSVLEVAEAGATLRAFGLDAEASIKSVTDLAAFMGRDLVESAGAVGRAYAAGIGASEILRESGIIQRVLDRTGKSVRDFSNDLPAFRDALLGTLTDVNVGIAGATDKLSKTLQGRVSNLNDAVDSLADTIGQRLLPETKAAVSELTSLVGELDLIIQNSTGLFEGIGLFSQELFTDVTNIFREHFDPDPLTTGAIDTPLDRIKAQANEQIVISQMLEDEESERVASLEEGLEREVNARLEAVETLQAYQDLQIMQSSLNKSLNEEMKEMNKLFSDNGDVLSRVNIDTVEYQESVDKLRLTWRNARSEIQEIAGVIGSTITDSLFEGMSVMESFEERFKRMLANMVAELLQKAAIFGILKLLGVSTGGVGFTEFIGVGGGVLGQLSTGIGSPGGATSGVFNVTINTTDPKSFEEYLRQSGGAQAIANTLPELV